jgi:formylglycine-generating enzyme required for sulfatase activity
MFRYLPLVGICVSVTIGLCFLASDVPLAGQEKKAKELKHLEVDVARGVKMKIVYIEPGKFMMGSPKDEKEREDNELQHEVEITKGFWMGVHEVTQEEYDKVMGEKPSFFTGARLPVERVSWDKAMKFCEKLRKTSGKTVDLPTEAEWEYACRAGSKTVFHYGNSLSWKQANIHGEFPYGGADKGPWIRTTTKVGSFEPNAFGLYDMHGNVWEWCKDWYKSDYYKESPLQDPPGPATAKDDANGARVLRGGTWAIYASHCRAAYRYNMDSEHLVESIGFRVVVRLP